MFSRLFRGKKRNRPQHSAQRTKQRPGRDQLGDADPERRLGALAAIGKPTDTEQRQIDELISEDPDVRVRRRAIELCQDQSLLLRLLEDDAVAEAAAGRLVALDPERTVNGALGGNHPAVLKALLGAGRLPDIPWLTDCDPETLLEFVLVSRGEAQQRLLEHAAFQQADNLTLLERASRDKVKNVNRFARDRLEGLKQLRAECDQLDQRLQEAQFGLAQHDPNQQGMGTTVSVLAMCGDYGITAQVGDSRIYLIRGHSAEPLTEDHTLVAWQLKQGIITEAEAARSPHRNVITRAVGSREYVQVDTGFFEVRPSDAYLLCSDGLHGYLREHEIPDVIEMGPKGAAQRFIAMANSRGGRDNITAVVVSVR